MPKEVNAITRLYDYLLWMIPKIDAFPKSRITWNRSVYLFTVRNAEFTGLRMESLFWDAVFCRPKYKPSPLDLVARANDRAGNPIKNEEPS